MKIKVIAMCVALVAYGATSARAQQVATGPQDTNEQRVPLTEPAIALNARGQTALAGHLRTTALNGSADSPVQNVRLVIENRSPFFYNYASGWATFYDAQGVRCGEGLFKVDALAVGESAEMDTPGLRIRCAPASWRITATNLLTRTSDTAKPNEPPPTESLPRPESLDQPASATTEKERFVYISVDGKEYRVPLGSTLNIPVNGKQVTITVIDRR